MFRMFAKDNEFRTNNLIAAILLLTLYTSVNTVFLLSPALLVITFISAFLIYLRRERLSKKTFLGEVHSYNNVFLLTIIIYMYLIISSLVSGISITEFLQFSFYRFDGNLFYSYSPLLLLLFIKKHTLDMEKLLTIFVVIVPYILVLFSVVLSIPFFDAHNAYGGFMGIITLVNIILMRKDKRLVFALLPNILLLYHSDSRGSLLAVVIALFIYLLDQKNLLILKRIVISSLIIFMAFIFYEGYSVWKMSGEPIAPTLEDAVNLSGDLQLDEYTETFFSYIERSYTIVHRAYFYWPVAQELFYKSPIFGVGFSRYDDLPFNLTGIDYLFLQNHSEAVLHTNYHAHNSFLHILAELGLVGFLLLFILFKKILSFGYKLKNDFSGRIIIVLTYYMLFVSLSEHRLTTPSQMVPYLSIFVLLITMNRKEKLNNVNNNKCLVVAGDFPYPPNYGGRKDVWERIVLLKKLGYEIDLVATIKDSPSQSEINYVKGYVENIIFVKRKYNVLDLLSNKPFQAKTRKELEWLNLSNSYQWVILEGDYVFPVLNNSDLTGKEKYIYRMHNDESLYFSELASSETSFPRKLIQYLESIKFKSYTKTILKKINYIWFISSDEKQKFEQINPNINGLFVPPHVPNEQIIKNEGINQNVLFVGSLFMINNKEAVIWYLSEIHDKVSAKIPDYHFSIAGNSRGERLEWLYDAIKARKYNTNVSVIDSPEDLMGIYKNNSIFVNPMLHGAGVKIKTIEALQFGLAVVSTSIGAEGTGLKNGVHLMVKDEPEKFCEDLCNLLNDKHSKATLVNNAQKYIADEFDLTKKLSRFFTENR